MNIVMIHPHDIKTSPWTVRITQLATSFCKAGHAVHLFTFIEQDRRAQGFFTANEHIYPFAVQELHKFDLAGNFLILKEKLKRADILHIQKCFAHAVLPALLASLYCQCPIHYDWDDWEEGITRDFMGEAVFTRIVRFYERRLPRIADSLSVSSDALEKRALSLGFDRENILKVPVGAHLEEFHPDVGPDEELLHLTGKGPLVLYAGQLEGANYANLFIDAAGSILEKMSEVCFLVVGGGFRLDELKNRAASLGILEKVHFTGYVLRKRMPGILKLADVCVATFEDNEVTRSKSPLKIVEYMAMGKAIVASDVGEVTTMLTERGVLVPAGDSEAISAAVIRLLEDPEKRAQCSLLARQAVEQMYNWDRSAGKLLELYQKIINDIKHQSN